MKIKNSQMETGFSRDYQAFDLTELGIADVPIVYSIRHTKLLEAIELHIHKGCFEIGLCLRGSLTLENCGTQHHILAGEMFLNKPQDAHRLLGYPKGTVLFGMLLRTENARKTFLRFNDKESQEVVERLNQLPPHLTGDSRRIKQYFHDIFHAYKSYKGEYRTLCLNAICMHLIVDLLALSQSYKSPSQAKRINDIVKMMHSAPEVDYSLDALAHQAALSPSHFIHQFKCITGLPPRHFLLKCRINEAKRRLLESDTLITEIALALGFCSSQHFADHFKRDTGMSPSAWRKTQGGSIKT